METADDLLELILPEETLDNLLQTSTSLKTLNYLLQIKHRRIIKGQSEKVDFSVDRIYDDNVDIDLATAILRKSLFVAANTESQLSKALKYCLNELQFRDNTNQLFYALSLFNVILEYHTNEHKLLKFKEYDFTLLHDGILTILKGSSKLLITFTLVHVFPNYLKVTDKEITNILLTRIFTFIKESKKLEILCMCFDKFIKFELNSDFNLLTCDDFWFLLKDCLVDQQHYMRRQASYLLSKTIDLALQPNNLLYLPKYLKCDNINEVEKVWRNYLILLDVSNEKQLHIVEPSLYMFNSVIKLDFFWRDCLYKIFLNHSQDSVVYDVAAFILQNETEWLHFSKISKVLLCAINKNAYSSESKRIFQEISSFCDKLENSQFEFFLHESLTVPWIPAAIWGFYSHVFNNLTNFQISLPLLESIIKNLKLLPHVVIRSACTKIVLTYFMERYNADSLQDLIKFICLLQHCKEILKETVFEDFLKNNESRIQHFSNELYNYFVNCVTNDEYKNLDCEISLKILQLLKLETSPQIPTPGIKADWNYLLLGQHFNQNDTEKYLMERIDLLENYEDISILLILCNKNWSVKISEKALNILLEKNTEKYNNNQKIVAFGIINKSDIRNYNSIINLWKNQFLVTTNNVDEQITKFFVKILLKYSDKFSTVSEVEQSITILENMLDAQSEITTTILENVFPILKYVEHEIVLNCVERCFEELLVLIKSNKSSKSTTKKFLSQMFQADLLKSDRFGRILVNFSEKLLDIANSFNSVAFILSKNLVQMLQQNCAKGFIFIPIIMKLTFHGIIVNKTERVDYCVCREIESSLSNEGSPNFEQISARLLALESMLILVNREPPYSENVAYMFISLLMERYMKYFSKRYFPDSQIHLEKLRILQSLMLLYNYITTEKDKLIEFIIQSFLLETHQPSVKHLMQWLLIMLTKNESQAFMHSICDKLKTIDNNRPATVSGLIPVLYHLVAQENETDWDRIVENLLPYTMGAQFKLRIFSQVALVKIYEKATTMQQLLFLQKYKFLYESLTQIIEATRNAPYDVANIYHEFLDYFSLEDCNSSTIFYTIPKNNGVTEIEWENLSNVASFHQLEYLKFNHNEDTSKRYCVLQKKDQKIFVENFQRKITPWKDMLDTPDSTKGTDDFILVTSLIEKPANLGGLSRTCEVFDIKKMVMRTSKTTTDKEFKSLSMSSENWVDIAEVKVEDLQKFILGVKKQGYSVIAAEQTSESVKLDKFRFPKKTVLVLGNEKEGIPPDLIPLMDTCIEIPQFGVVRSLNVHVAGAIVIWEYCKQQKL